MLNTVFEWLASQDLLLLVALLLLVGSVFIYRRFRDAPARVQLLGTTAYFLYHALGVFTEYTGAYMLHHPESPFARAIYPTDTVRPGLNITSAVLELLSLLFPVGFAWLSIRVRRRI